HCEERGRATKQSMAERAQRLLDCFAATKMARHLNESKQGLSLRGARSASWQSPARMGATPEGDLLRRAVALVAMTALVGCDPRGNRLPAARIFMQSWCAPARYRAALAMTT